MSREPDLRGPARGQWNGSHGPAVDFAGRKLDQAFAVTDTGLGDPEILRKIEAKDLQRDLDVQPWVGVGNQIDDKIRVLNGAFDIPISISDILLQEREPVVFGKFDYLVVIEVHSHHVVILAKQPVRQVGSDKAAGPENKDVH